MIELSISSQVATSVLALNYSKPEWIPRSNWEAVTLSDMQITCAALDAWVAREATLYMQGVSKTRPIQDFSSPGAALAQKGILEGKSSGGERQQGMPSHSYEDREPDKILYIPKVDLREGGSYAYWLWRGTMVSDKHIEQYCGVHLELDDTESATVAALWGDKRAISEAVAYMENVRSYSPHQLKHSG